MSTAGFVQQFYRKSEESELCKPRLNMAIPSPASDKIEIDLAMIAGISIPHLKLTQCGAQDQSANQMWSE